MIQRSFFLAALVVGLLLGIGICRLGIAVSQPAAAQVILQEDEGPTRYEYKVLVFTGMNGVEFEKTMNNLGNSGWEYVGTVQYRNEVPAATAVAFKRPLRY
jgi:hypothetical protein